MKGGCFVLEAKGFSVMVLAGGKSSRMGQDKALLAWEQGNMLGSVLTRLLSLSDDVFVSTNIERKVPQGVTQIRDVIPGKGPLSGIHAGLLCARHDLVVVTSCDMPFLKPELIYPIVHSVKNADGSVAVYKGRLEPLFACYRKNCRAIIEQLLAEENYSVRNFLNHINWVAVQQVEDCSFMNVNTYKDYEEAKARLAKGR